MLLMFNQLIDSHYKSLLKKFSRVLSISLTVASLEVINLSYSSPRFFVSASPTIIYKSGKTPYIEGSSLGRKDSNSESKKDISFLRCISNCKAKCQLPGEGLAKNDCVQDCQDQCCNSYEQCSFRIKPTAGNTI